MGLVVCEPNLTQFLVSMSFSEREGYKKIKDIQIESINNELTSLLTVW